MKETTSPAAVAQTMQQQRAKYALEQVENAKAAGIDQKKFKSYAAGFPAMVQMNGLGQAAAFFRCQANGEKPEAKAYKRLYDLLSGWLCKDNQPFGGKNDMLQGITNGNMYSYSKAQAEALLLLDWVKKFAKAYMEK